MVFTNCSIHISIRTYILLVRHMLELRLPLRYHSNGVHPVTKGLGWGGELSDDCKLEVVHAAREEDFRSVLIPILWPDKREVPEQE